jgi:hypothetical protein
MILQEITNPKNYQSIITCDNDEDSNRIKFLLKLNLLSRLFDSVKNELSKIEIRDRVLPLINVKVSEFNNEELGKKLFLANLNKPINESGKYNPISENIVKSFSDIGINLPSKDILRDRLYSFSDEDVIDPFRLYNLELDDCNHLDISDVDYSYLENSEFLFRESFYSNIDHSTMIYYDKVKSTIILSFNDIIKTE